MKTHSTIESRVQLLVCQLLTTLSLWLFCHPALAEVNLSSSKTQYLPGESFSLGIEVNNTRNTEQTAAVFIVLGYQGSFFFLPNYTNDATAYFTLNFPANFRSGVFQLVSFTSPYLVTPLELTWYGVMLELPSFTPQGELSLLSVQHLPESATKTPAATDTPSFTPTTQPSLTPTSSPTEVPPTATPQPSATPTATTPPNITPTPTVTICPGDNSLNNSLYACSVTLSLTNSVSISLNGNNRVITANNIPNHTVGPFPNANNPNTIRAQSESYTVSANPTLAANITNVQGANGPAYAFGIGLNGVEFDPAAAEPWVDRTTNQRNWNWNLEALVSFLGLDCNSAHVQPTGKYHYHGIPVGLTAALNAGSDRMTLVGYAADGFPIYSLYAYNNPTDPNSGVREMLSSHSLKVGYRPGDNVSAPCGEYNGKYVQDWEYIAGQGDLDECNGRTGVTPEYPNGTYYYVLSREFPVIPRCFKGTPNTTFAFGPRP